MAFAPRDILERGEEKEKDGLVGLAAERYEGVRFTVSEGENVVELWLVADTKGADDPKTAEPEGDALNDGDSETADAEETWTTLTTAN